MLCMWVHPGACGVSVRRVQGLNPPVPVSHTDLELFVTMILFDANKHLVGYCRGTGAVTRGGERGETAMVIAVEH